MCLDIGEEKPVQQYANLTSESQNESILKANCNLANPSLYFESRSRRFKSIATN